MPWVYGIGATLPPCKALAAAWASAAQLPNMAAPMEGKLHHVNSAFDCFTSVRVCARARVCVYACRVRGEAINVTLARAQQKAAHHY